MKTALRGASDFDRAAAGDSGLIAPIASNVPSPHMRKSRLLALLFCLGCANSLQAQTAALQHEGTFVFPWFVLGDPWRPHSMRVGQFDSDGLFDLVLDAERSGVHRLLYVGAVIGRDVATYIVDPLTSAPLEALAFDVAPHLAGVGGSYTGMTRSAVVCTGPFGLRAGYLLPSAASNLARFEFDALGGSEWRDAPLVRAADVNLDGVTDFVGVNPSGLGVLVTTGADLATTTFTCTSPILTLDVLRWDTVGQPELAILTHTGVEVRTLSGSLIAAFPNAPDANGLMTVLRGQNIDRLAWIHRTAAEATLSALSSALGLDGPHVLPIDEPVSLASGDVDRDRHADILVGSARTQAPLYFRNRRPELPTFDVNAGSYVDACIERIVMDGEDLPSLEWGVGTLLSTTDSQARCAPLMADLDGDGRCDALVPSYMPGTATTMDLALLVFTGTKPDVEPYDACPTASALPLTEPPSACTPLPNKIYSGMAELASPGGAPHLKYTLQMKFNASSCPSIANTIGVTVWQQNHESAAIEAKAVHDYHFPIDRTSAWDPTSTADTRLEVYVDCNRLGALPTPEGKFCSAKVLWLEIKAMSTIDPTTPVVFSSRYVAVDMAMQSEEVLILDGGVLLCNPGLETLCPPPQAPTGTFLATTGPIYIVRRPRLPSPGAGHIMETPEVQRVEPSGAPGYLGAADL